MKDFGNSEMGKLLGGAAIILAILSPLIALAIFQN
jgi:hypothetical protein